MSGRQRFTQVDAFTERAFAGNPAAVCLLPSPADPVWMQQVAREMNLAETSFLVRQNDSFSLRWFTPSVEVDLCGHATLASAHVLWEEQELERHETARFHTRSGLLTACREGDLIWMDFPATPSEPAESPPEIKDGLGAITQYVGRTRFDYLVEMESESALRALVPDLGRLSRLPVRGVIVTARSENAEYDFVSRFFAPAAGVPEDPVTGSAHCALGPYWGTKLKKSAMVGYQASARGGTVLLQLNQDQVRLGGHAVTVLHGELLH
ncbi:MAG TPA: PhzF family phenazine biosynthesis protein [Gemmatimonadales bacterium]|nr:PhzF family phenazine biosynthesis protein [Gemmatimonadales bacterium]